MECTICKGFGRVIKKLITTTQYFFHKDFIKENYDKHFFYTREILIYTFILLSFLPSFRETQMLFKVLLGFIIGGGINWFRESTMEAKYKAPFSEEDIIFGAYAGMKAGAIVDLGLILLKLK